MLLHQFLLALSIFTAADASANAYNQIQIPTSNQQTTFNDMDTAQYNLARMMRQYAAYNLWANRQICQWLDTASQAQLNQVVESSFSSLSATAIHIWSAEVLWLQIIKNEPTEQSPAKNFKGDKVALIEGWLSASENFSKHVAAMTEADFQEKRPRAKGNGYTHIVEMIQHCMNHSTYHRGQLITMGRQVGLANPPRTDFIYYISLQEEK